MNKLIQTNSAEIFDVLMAYKRIAILEAKLDDTGSYDDALELVQEIDNTLETAKEDCVSDDVVCADHLRYMREQTVQRYMTSHNYEVTLSLHGDELETLGMATIQLSCFSVSELKAFCRQAYSYVRYFEATKLLEDGKEIHAVEFNIA